ncbi:MAG: hypothetical protein GYA23_09590 [Methanomicrobiales archaeon]|nr:hypothetical protein [Methanomicrobiales archaeon]
MSPQPACTDGKNQKKSADALQQFFSRPIFLSFTIGIPFCIFKLLFGITAFRLGAAGDTALTIFGAVIIVWATSDLFMNLGRCILDLAHREALFEYCTISQLGRVFGKQLAFLAFDTLVTFCIICAMLWLGWITKLDRFEMILWYAATTLNLISLSLVVLYNEIRNS